ncbi:response regulator [Methylobacterium radiodurans]|uniref:Response regulator n=1 Tax=Methylobacterium radiodurans TaxID=2202828 RepID=A0A2U8VUA5_9HYPH|nr:response regulator [Methylobacterium radiodurans]AWN36706.1 response regulator [Methylobacterium radiodurans]
MIDADPQLAGLHILLVEDDYVVAVEMERWLRGAGASVVGPVARIEQALALIVGQVLDAAVLDINLDVGLGAEDTVYPLADRLDALGVPYLFVTGDVRVGRLPRYAAKPRLEKPLQEAELAAALRGLLDARAAEAVGMDLGASLRSPAGG